MSECQQHESPERLLQEWEQLDQVIGAAENYLAECKGRLSVVQEKIDSMTKPPLVDSPIRRYQPSGFEYKGQFYRHAHKIDIYMGILKLLFNEFPQQTAIIVSRVQLIGRSRSYLSRDREALFPGKSHAWTSRHCAQLDGEWWADTNLSGRTMISILSAATRSVGIKLGGELKTSWSPRFVSNAE